ncbi:LolA-related protein [Ideonella oryzae]|uniref:Outer membrane lipoprotein carrier protein LolA n=1 Tax=Ideonella oryzae TaxID=2937441 RepID=A0ABT1BIJ8_9BURK|nr:LolA-related protein [Ideonella oryzae]MCO5976030.1 outer membrane lipoprotein carrier protein LolA [Ideonella oryzae]
MTSGTRPFRRSLDAAFRPALLTLTLAFSSLSPAWAQAWTPAALMQSLATHKSAKATFVERKYLAVLDQPVESRGELSFTAPDRLEKRTLSPRPESLVLQGDLLTVDDANKRHMTVNLGANPEAAAFVESIRGTLAGDLATLQKYYALELTGSPERWKLLLLPQQPRMAKLVSRIRIEGAGTVVRLIVFEQADGDRSEMQVTPVTAP